MASTERRSFTDEMSVDKPNPARMYDYWLGGHHNFAADRAAADKISELIPSVAQGAAVQRAFLRRVIDFFASEGIDQFLDIGSGLPTVGNVHELARENVPDARVVYVDIDPVVVAYASQMLKDVAGVTIIEGDLGYPPGVLTHEDVRDLLDFDRPLGLTMTAVFHFITDDEVAYGAARTLIDVLAPGSCVAMSHLLLEEESREAMEKAIRDHGEGAPKPRWRDEIERFFDGLELVEPGLVRAPLWRPESAYDLLLDNPEGYAGLAGVGHKPWKR